MCDPGQAADPYAALLRAIDVFVVATQAPGRTAAAVGEDLVRKQHAIDLLRLDVARDAARFDATDECEVQGFTTPIAWLTHVCHMSPGEAGAAVCVGRQAGTLQRSVAEVRERRIGFAHLAHMARASEAVQLAGVTLDEERLLARARTSSPHRFRRDCAHARHAADTSALLADERAQRAERFLDVRALSDDGGFWIRGYLDAAGGTVLRAVLDPLARRTDATDHRSRPRRLADALVEMAEFTLATGGEGEAMSTHRRVPSLLVTTTLETLTRQPGASAAELEGRLPISNEALERLCCSASVTRVVFGPDSAVIDVGRARRLPSAPARKALAARDRGCTWPGCDRSVRWTQPHHVAFWTRDRGSTEIPNLASVCSRHHDLVHLEGWQVVRVAGQREVMTVPPIPLPEPSVRGPSRDAVDAR